MKPTTVLNLHHYLGTRRSRFPMVPNLPEDAVYVGRAGRGYEGYFGNPHRPHWVGPCLASACQAAGLTHTGEECLIAYSLDLDKRWLEDQTFVARAMELQGKPLLCFCVKKDGSGPCHAKILAQKIDVEAAARAAR